MKRRLPLNKSKSGSDRSEPLPYFIRIEASGKTTCLESSRRVFRASGCEDLSTRLRIISGLSNPSASLPFCFAIFFSRFLWSYCLQFVTFHSSKFTYCFFLRRIKTENAVFHLQLARHTQKAAENSRFLFYKTVSTNRRFSRSARSSRV